VPAQDCRYSGAAQSVPTVRAVYAHVVNDAAVARCADLEIDLTHLVRTDIDIDSGNSGWLDRRCLDERE
jgi:hypothetical protein